MQCAPGLKMNSKLCNISILYTFQHHVFELLNKDFFIVPDTISADLDTSLT